MRKKRGLLGALIITEFLILVAVIVVGVVLGGPMKQGAIKIGAQAQPAMEELNINPMADTLEK